MIFFISDGGDKEKMECFVDFCEDAIFEMQISTALSGDDGEVAKVCQNLRPPMFQCFAW